MAGLQGHQSADDHSIDTRMSKLLLLLDSLSIAYCCPQNGKILLSFRLFPSAVIDALAEDVNVDGDNPQDHGVTSHLWLD